MKRIGACIGHAQALFAELLESYLKDGGATTVDQYVRYLSFQYHLTKGVQRYFMAAAAHPDLARRRGLRAFLVRFANEEELHYRVAADDLHELGLRPLPAPLDVELWHSYFETIVDDRPFVRLGAANVLENISGGTARRWVKQALTGPFLTRDNTKFFVLHQYETLPHGEQIMEALAAAKLEERHLRDLEEGALKGAVLYLRMAEWAVRPTCLATICDRDDAEMSAADLLRIHSFNMAELEDVGG